MTCACAWCGGATRRHVCTPCHKALDAVWTFDPASGRRLRGREPVEVLWEREPKLTQVLLKRNKEG